MMKSESYGWAIAILMSLLIHSMVLLNGGAKMGAEDTSAIQVPMMTRLNFNPAITGPVQVVKRVAEKKKIEPVKKLKAETVRHEKTKQVIAPVSAVVPIIQQTAVSQVRGEQVNHSTDGILESARQRYLHELIGHIESYKYYPASARKRAIDGSVKMSFYLRSDGSYEKLVMEGGHTVLVNATRTTLEYALPLPLPPVEFDLSQRIEFTMNYLITN